MQSYAALIRALNVGGTGKLTMSELVALCGECGFEDARTYIQSGNVVFRSRLVAARAKGRLEAAVEEHLGRPHQVLIRTQAELEATLASNPFPAAAPNRLLVFFFDEAPPKSALTAVRIPGTEELRLVGRELFVHFPDGQGKSKLKIPLQDRSTGRNLNTVTKLLAMLESS